MTQAILYSASLLDRLLSRVSSVFIVLSRWNVDLTETSLLNVFSLNSEPAQNDRGLQQAVTEDHPATRFFPQRATYQAQVS